HPGRAHGIVQRLEIISLRGISSRNQQQSFGLLFGRNRVHFQDLLTDGNSFVWLFVYFGKSVFQKRIGRWLGESRKTNKQQYGSQFLYYALIVSGRAESS